MGSDGLRKLRFELERVILGEILYLESYEKQLEAIVELSNIKFEHPKFSEFLKVYIIIVAVDKSAINQISVASHNLDLAKNLGLIDKDVHSSAFLMQHIRELKGIIYKEKVINQTRSKIKDLVSVGSFKEFEKVKDSLIVSLSGMSLEKESEFINFDELDVQLMENISREKNNVIDGFSFGIKELDIFTNGIQLSKFYVVGGLKKAGKTRFLIHVVRELYKQGVPTAFLSLEIPKYDLFKLLKSSFVGIEDTKLRSGSQKYLSKTELDKIKSLKFDEKRLMIECTVGLGIAEVISRLRKYAKLGAKVVFIDFLQRINVDVRNKVNEIEEMTRLLADASRELGLAVILLSQLSNVAEREVPSILHLKGSGGIGEAADVIMVLDNLYRRTGNSADRNLIDIELTQRYGESGKVKLFAELGSCTFKDYSRYSTPDEMMSKPKQEIENFDEEFPI